MGPYVGANAVLIGLFGFAAVYHLVLWWQARRDAVLLLFALHCTLCAVHSACLITLVAARTPGEGQRALDLRLGVAALVLATSVWLVSLITGLRARWFVWPVTVLFLGVAVVTLAFQPLTGTVTGVERIVTSWGEAVSVLHRESPSRWLPAVYAIAVASHAFGLVCAARLWRSDRVGSTLLTMASGALIASNLRAARLDAAGAPGLYLGAVPYAAWVMLMAVQIARDYRLRGERLEESREQLHRLAGGLLVAREEERTTIAREIHDVLGQTLTALKMDAAWIGTRVPGEAVRMKLAAMAALIDEAVMTVRRIATDLRPGVLDDLGLAAALEWQAQEFARRTGIECSLRAGADEDGLDPLVATAVFRIFQESLTNVVRHARATHVSGTLERRGADLVLEVQDDGIGITPAEVSDPRSIGLAGMRERAQLVGGRFSISSATGAGTTVRVQIPLRVGAGA